MMKKIYLALVLALLISVCPFYSAFATEKIEMKNPEVGIYIFKINTCKYGDKIKPYVTNVLTTPKSLYENKGFELVVNGGFFDVQNGKSVSYVTIDKELVSDIEDHEALVNSLNKEGRLEAVISRGELRILEDKNHKLKFDIALHTDPIDEDYTLIHSLQAGPILTPEMDLAKEGFVVYEDNVVKSQSVDILKRRERTMLALKGKWLYIVIFTKDHKADAVEMKEYMERNLKVDKAMALDGGLSTAIDYKDTSIGSLGKYQRRVKSFLIIER